MATAITVADLGKYLDKPYPQNYWENFVSKIKEGSSFDTVDGKTIVIDIDKFTGRSIGGVINSEINNDDVFKSCLEYRKVDEIEKFMRLLSLRSIPNTNTKSYNLPTSNGTIPLSKLLKSNIKSNINSSSVNNDDGSEIKTETQELISLYYFQLAIENTAKTFHLFDTWYTILIPETKSTTKQKEVKVGKEVQYMNEYLMYIVDDIAEVTKDELFVRTSDGGYVIEQVDGIDIFELSNRAKSWFQNFHKQEKVLLDEYKKPTILPTNPNHQFNSFKRIDTKGDETNVADWVAKFIRTNFNVELKHWDPADVWLTENNFFNHFKKKWDCRIKKFHKEQKEQEQAKLSKTDKKTTKKTTLSMLAEFNLSLQLALIEKKIWGISLKKVTGKDASMTLQNVEFGELKKMIGRNKNFLASIQPVIAHNNESKYKLESISYSNTANNGQLNFVPGNSKLPKINCQIRPNGNNLKFEAKYIPAAAQLGQVPVNMMQFALKKELSSNVVVFSNDYTKYPSTKVEYENTGKTLYIPYIMTTENGWKTWKTATQAMVSAIRTNLYTYIATCPDLNLINNDPSKYLSGTGSGTDTFSFKADGTNSQKARSNLMIICFLYNLSQISQQNLKENDPLHKFCAHMIELAEKIGTAHYEDEEDLVEAQHIKDIKFGPFYKIY